MKGHSRAWMLLPAAILGALVLGLVVSNLQVECGLMEPGKGQRAAVAAVIDARYLSSGDGAEDYADFDHALLAATVSQRNAAVSTAADVRVNNLIVQALDCLAALREAWQADIEAAWDPQAFGSAVYWNVLHPALQISQEGPLTPEEVRRAAGTQAQAFIDKALGLVD